MITPKVAKKPHEFIEHDNKRVDSYYWLRDKTNPEVIDYLNRENDYTKSALAGTSKFQDDLFKEMKGRIKEDDSSVPFLKNGYWYYTRYEEGSEYAIYARKKENLEAGEEVLLDENELAKPYDFYEIESFAISEDNKWLAFAEDISGRRQYQIKIKQLETGSVLHDVIENTSGDIAWHSDNLHFFYTLKDKKTLRPFQIKKHRINTPEDNDEVIYNENDEAFIAGVSKEKNGQFIFIGSWSTLTTEYHLLDMESDHQKFEVFYPRVEKLEYYPEASENGFYIKHNSGAKNFMLSYCKFNNRDKLEWQTIQIHDPNILIEDFEVFEAHLVVQEKKNGLTQLRVYDFEHNSSKLIPPKEEAFTLYLDHNPNYHTKIVRIKYSSLTTPTSVIDIDLVNFNETLKKQQKVIGKFKPQDYQSERIWAEANDGTQVPVSLVYKKDCFKKDGSNPILLYGYGSYGVTIDPYFSSVRLSLLDRGFVFAIAHIRGSEYLGTHWYEDGKFLKKKNTFTDFIKCAEILVSEKYGNKDKLFAMGGSAGGLLMGAIVNMRPEMWAGIVSNVPFVDVVTTMMDDSIPLTTGEYEEWGNPNDKSYYSYMLSYSPYDNIETKAYPPMLITSGLHDSQVQYWEPTKYVAKLRELKTDDNLLLLHTNMEAGHGGVSGRFEALKEIALEYAFILLQLNIKA